MATLRFWFHPRGNDNNGNNGPDRSDPGWVSVEVPETGDDVVDTAIAWGKLPPELTSKCRIPPGTTLRDLICDEAGMNLGFTFACEDWDEFFPNG